MNTTVIRRIGFLVMFLMAIAVSAPAQENTQELFRQAVIAANNHDFEDALRLYQQIIDQDASYLEAYNGLISVYIGKGMSLDQIKRPYEDKLVLNQEDAASLYVLGKIALAQKNLERAQDYLGRALLLLPANAQICWGLAFLEIEKGDFGKAKEYLSKVGNNNSDGYTLSIGNAVLAMRQAEKERSLQGIETAFQQAARAQSLRPYESYPYYLMATTHLFKMDFQEAEKLLLQALKLDKYDSMINAMHAAVLSYQGEYAQAKTALLTARENLAETDIVWGVDKAIDKLLVQTQVALDMRPMYLNILVFLVLAFSIILHEYMHGWFANKFGDPTARLAGRLSFNPLVHIDLFGSVLLPLMLLLNHAKFFIGYAKPVPINPANFKRPVRDEVLVSLAGPFSNFLFGLFLCGLLAIMAVGLRSASFSFSVGNPFSTTIVIGKSASLFWTYALNMLKQGVVINFMLAGFNLIPIPPLDGSHLLTVLLPAKWLRKIYAPLSMFGFIIVLFLVSKGWLDYALLPVMLVVYFLFSLIGI